MRTTLTIIVFLVSTFRFLYFCCSCTDSWLSHVCQLILIEINVGIVSFIADNACSAAVASPTSQAVTCCLCLLDENTGQVIKSAPTKTASAYQLATDHRTGLILITDSNRILLHSSELDYVSDIIPSVVGLSSPRAMCFNEEGSRLYVGEASGQCRLVAFSVRQGMAEAVAN